MSPIAAALVCLLVQEPDLEKSVDRLAERLLDDRIETRDQARRELLGLGAPVLPIIRRRAEKAELEVRERLLDVVREIERGERMKFFLGERRKIRLKADRRPIGDLLKELAAQSDTPVALKNVPPEEPVTVEIRGLPFFEALQQICLAHGGLQFRLPDESHSLETLGPVELTRGDPKACLPFVHGPFVITLDSVYTSGTLGKDDLHASLIIVSGWERGVRPIGMKVRVDSVVDETGAVVALVDQPPRDRDLNYIYRHDWRSLATPPPARVTTFRKISGTLEFEFPSDGQMARVERPMGRTKVEATGGAASFTLEEMVRVGPERVRVVVEVDWPAENDTLIQSRFYAVDDRNRIYLREGGRGKGGATPGRYQWTFFFDVPQDVQITELRVVKFKVEKDRPVTVKFPWTLENVRFR